MVEAIISIAECSNVNEVGDMSPSSHLPAIAINSSARFVLVGPSLGLFSEHDTKVEALRAMSRVDGLLPKKELFIYTRGVRDWLKC